MGKLASDVCSTVISLLVFAADTVHIDLVLIGRPTMEGVHKCFGLNRIYGPMLHIPSVPGRLDAIAPLRCFIHLRLLRAYHVCSPSDYHILVKAP